MGSRAFAALTAAMAMLVAAIITSAPAHATPTSGAYRIVAADDGRWLRMFEGSPALILAASTPPPGDGLWIWWLEPMGESDGEHFAIVNHTRRAALSAAAHPGAAVGTEPESESSTRWALTPAGDGTYYLSYPGTELRAAGTSEEGSPDVVLRAPGPAQRWELRWVGDY
ncbi:hypothetical protein ABZ319_35600 [Nocardia sp. NPDC005978]|uniref:hypothetical protein n=1 Tax=Nocardia sp. NPDC005978 TaxID=3156725 RepID=UPI0033B18536